MATIKKVKAKNLSACPSKMTKKAGPVDPKGAYTKVQERTLGNMKKGGKIKKAQDGTVTKNVYYKIKGYPDDKKPLYTKSVDTTGYAEGKKDFTINSKYSNGESKSWNVPRKTVKKFLKEEPEIQMHRKGGKVTKAKDGKWMQKVSASIKKRGTEGVCTGKKFGGPTCKPGSKRYNLAKVFKGMAKKKK